MTLQLRPKEGGQNAPFYAPARDLAHCFPSLCRQAIYGLNDVSLEDWFKDYLSANKVTNDDLCKVAEAVAKGLGNYAEEQYATPMDALLAAGFYDTHPIAQAAFCIKLGQCFLGSYFTAVRDILHKDSPIPLEIKELVEVAAQLQKGMDAKAAEQNT